MNVELGIGVTVGGSPGMLPSSIQGSRALPEYVNYEVKDW